MKAIGLTGGIASGKTTVCNIIKQYGIPVISADELAHQSIKKGKPLYDRIIEEFGPDILDLNGEINRKRLGKIIFADQPSRRKLESFIHPVVIKEIERIIAGRRESSLKLMVFEVPLLFEAGMMEIFDSLWVVSVPRDIQIKRLMQRDGLTEIEAEQRIKTQLPMAEKEAKADYIIYNIQGVDYVRKQISSILKDFGVILCKEDL